MSVFLVRCTAVDSLKALILRLPPAGIAIIGWFWSAWAAFMPFNYRPVRYQIVLLLPLAASAGWLIGQLGRREGQTGAARSQKTSWYVLPFLALILGTGIQHLALTPWFVRSGAMTPTGSVVLALVLASAVAAVWIGLARREPSAERPRSRRIRGYLEVLAGITILVMLVNQGRYFERWWSVRQHTLEDANRDLELIVGEGAILTGGYGTALTQHRRIGNFPAMFGVSKPDYDFFRKYPVTHVAEVDLQDQRFFRDYPDIAEGAQRVTTYVIRNLPIAIYRVSAVGENAEASTYNPSSFERMRSYCGGLPRDTVLSFLPEWIADSADCYSGWYWLGDVYYSSGRLGEALDAFQRAARTASDNYLLWALIAEVSWQIFRTGSSGEYRQLAIDAWTRAMQLNPKDPRLAAGLAKAYGQ
jgi:hypothetical protein